MKDQDQDQDQESNIEYLEDDQTDVDNESDWCYNALLDQDLDDQQRDDIYDYMLANDL